MPVEQRADARRNHARILAVAEEEVAANGADASMERIARIAGVGSATVRRHFPTRRALLEAVSQSRIEALCDRARELAGDDDGRGALLEWLGEVVAYAAAARGLAAVLAPEGAGPDSAPVDGCSRKLAVVADPLLRRAVREGAVDESVTFADLMSLIVGIALATEHDPDPAARADRLFRLAVAGLSPR